MDNTKILTTVFIVSTILLAGFIGTNMNGETLTGFLGSVEYESIGEWEYTGNQISDQDFRNITGLETNVKWKFFCNTEKVGETKDEEFEFSWNNCREKSVELFLENPGEVEKLRLRPSRQEAVLEGEVPEEISKLENVEKIDLGKNSLEGEIPGELEELQSLEELNLEENKFNNGIIKLEGIKTINLSSNNFSGEVSLQSFENLESIDISWNDFKGYIPDLSGNRNITEIKMQENNFTDYHNSSLSNLPNLGESKGVFLYGNSFSQQDIDSILSDIRENTEKHGIYNMTLDIKDTTPPSVDGFNDKDWLQEQGMEVKVQYVSLVSLPDELVTNR